MEDELEDMTEAWIEVLQDEVKLLEYKLARLKKGATPFSTALITARAQINAFEKKNQELRTMAENREQLKAWLAAWVNTYIVHQGGPNYMEVTLLQDDYSRRRGCVSLTNRTHMMSQEAYPCKPFGNCVEDKIDVKLHLRDDQDGVCIQAFESNVQFTVEGNYETVAKTWRCGLTESSAMFNVMVLLLISTHHIKDA
ncbi:hypothetical protein AC1031_016757 [Aphanomyces cochlioides]|nr:hypothetical protein AC1031_016757 [Aphanomyces cochlioides]